MGVENATLDISVLSLGCGCAACARGETSPSSWETGEDGTQITQGTYRNSSSDTPDINDADAPSEAGTKEQFAEWMTNLFWGGGGSYDFVGWGSDTTISYSISNYYSAAEKTGIRDAFDLWSDVTNLTFTDVGTSGGDIYIVGPSGSSEQGRAFASPSTAWNPGSNYTEVVFDGVRIVMDYDSGGFGSDPTDYGNYALTTAIHEIGHALGLGHTGDYNAGNGNPTYANSAQWTNDTRQYSLMSYWSATNSGGTQYEYPATPMLMDIYAIQTLYGANYSTRSGNTTYGFNSTAGHDVYDFAINDNPTLSIWDGAGTDTLDFSGYSNNQLITLISGNFSNVGGGVGNISIAYGAVIENAVGGSGNDIVYGNYANNILTGNAGNDTFYGSTGSDTIDGGTDSSGDTLTYTYDISDFLITLVNSITATFEYLVDGWTDTISNIEHFLFDGSSYDWAEILDFAQDSGLRVNIWWNSGSYARDFNTDVSNTLDAVDLGYGGASGNMLSVVRNGTGATTINILNESMPENMQLNTYDIDDNIAVTGNDVGSVRAYAGEGDDVIDMNIDSDDFLYGEDGDDTIRGGSGSDRLYGDKVNSGDTATGNDSLYGEDGDDFLYGHGGDDILDGGNGNDQLFGQEDSDTLYGSVGNDILDGGAGTDLVNYASLTSGISLYMSYNRVDKSNGETDIIRNIENITATVYSDLLVLSDADNIVIASGGADEIYARGGNDTIYGGDDDDRIYGMDGDDVIRGGDGSDRLYGDKVNGSDSWIGNDEIYGEGGNDFIYGHGGNDILNGGDGNDTVYGMDDDDYLYGGAGTDTLDGDDGDDYIYGGDGNDLIRGGNGSDRLYGDKVNGGDSWTGNDVIYGGAGDDFIYGHAGDDTLFGNDDSDTLYGQEGNDRLFGGTGTDILDGGDGDDLLYGEGGNDLIQGGDGSDRLYGDKVNSGDSATGDDIMYGGNGDDYLYGHRGNDTLVGGAGNDITYGMEDDDIFIGGSGNDYLNGGSGNDTLDYSSSGTSVDVYLTHGRVEKTGGELDTISGIENITTTNYADLIVTDNNDNVIQANGGSDNVYARGGNDTIYGRDGSDMLYGMDGDDTIYGGNGADRLYGDKVISVDSWTGNDILRGDGGDDVLLGHGGEDILDGGDGSDDLYGQEGSDVFALTSLTGGADTFADFTLNGVERDSINITDILSGYDSDTDDLNDFVRLVYENTNQSTLEVNVDGQGSDWQSAAIIRADLSGVSVDDLVGTDQLIANQSLFV